MRRGNRQQVAASSSCRNAGAVYPKVGETPEGYPILTGKGSTWGQSPILYTGVEARLTVPSKIAHVFALDGNGLPLANPVSHSDQSVVLHPSNRTLWYEVEL